MERGRVIRNMFNGRYAIYLGTTASGMASVCQINWASIGRPVRGSRTTWRRDSFELAPLEWCEETDLLEQWAMQVAEDIGG